LLKRQAVMTKFREGSQREYADGGAACGDSAAVIVARTAGVGVGGAEYPSDVMLSDLSGNRVTQSMLRRGDRVSIMDSRGASGRGLRRGGADWRPTTVRGWPGGARHVSDVGPQRRRSPVHSGTEMGD